MSGTSFEFSGKRSGLAFTPFSTVSTVAPRRTNQNHTLVQALHYNQLQVDVHLTKESVCKADGLGGNGRPESPPVCRYEGRLTDEAVDRVDKLGRVALVVFVGHVGDVICADGGSLPLQQTAAT